MASKMMQFTKVKQRFPDKRNAEKRVSDFNEIYEKFSNNEAVEQASRCEQCGTPFCHVTCPLHNNIPDWIMLLNAGRTKEAFELLSSTNPMPEITGRVCPQDRLCENRCVLALSGHGNVTIGSLEKYLADYAFEKDWIAPPSPKEEKNKSVAIIGAGPAGMTAAAILRKKGYKIELFDRYKNIGGLLLYAIPGFKLEKDRLRKRAELLIEAGVVFHPETSVGKDISFTELQKKHDAILIACGANSSRKLSITGANSEGVISAMGFLSASNKKLVGEENESIDAKDKDVIVIGGGDTAMDCLRTALRQGAKSAKCLYRRDRANMPGSQKEVDNAIAEGVEFKWLTSPEAILEKQRKVIGVRCVQMKLGSADRNGRRTPEKIEGTQQTEKADIVIEALGFTPESTEIFSKEIASEEKGTIKADKETMQSSIEGIFAAGDIVQGPSLVVNAIRDAITAANSIHKYLNS